MIFYFIIYFDYFVFLFRFPFLFENWARGRERRDKTQKREENKRHKEPKNGL